MNRKPTLTIFNSPRKTIGKYAYPFILITFFIVLGSTSSLIHAQKTIMRMEMNTPEWNGKQECDKGNGYRLAAINAPSVNYSGDQIKDAKYDYVWEQKINNEIWTEVASGKNSIAIRGYNPKIIHNSKAGDLVKKYSWRIKLTDIANGNQTLISEEYSFSLASPILIHYEARALDVNRTNYSFQITATGGFPNKTFHWKSLNNKKMPEAQTQKEDPEGVAPGEYELLVQDASCSTTKKLSTSTSNTN